MLGVWSRWFGADEAYSGTPGHVLAMVYEVTEFTGELRTTFDEGTTDAAAWFSLDEVRSLRRVEQVDRVLELLE
jgi:hypothetical protein